MKSRRPVPITDRKFPLFPKLIATSFGAGFLPVAPGTWGALVAIALWLPLYLFAPSIICLVSTLIAIALFAVAGTWASGVAERYWGKDPVAACVDETVGQWIALVPLCGGKAAAPWWLIIVSLGLFRVLDIYKPFGIRRLERLPGGVGMMADDVAAGVLAGVAVAVVLTLIQ